jgi:excisionase family DNA binding protein
MSSTHSVKSVSETLAVSERTVLAWIASGELIAWNASRKSGAKRPSWRIPQEALEKFMLLRTATPPPPRTRRRKRPADVIEFY